MEIILYVLQELHEKWEIAHSRDFPFARQMEQMWHIVRSFTRASLTALATQTCALVGRKLP